MISEAKVEERSEQHYVGIRVQVTMAEMPAAIDKAFPQLFGWLGEKHIAPSAAPIIRYHVINMEEKMDIEMGVPVASPISGDTQVSADVLPAGRYATLLHTGHYDGLMEATRVLIEWAKEQGLVWDNWEDENGDAFRSRYESYLTDPMAEPDSSKWGTEIAIKLAD